MYRKQVIDSNIPCDILYMYKKQINPLKYLTYTGWLPGILLFLYWQNIFVRRNKSADCQLSVV